MHPLIALLDFVISLYSLAVFIYVVIQILAYFKILNTEQPVVIQINKFLNALVEPALSKIRKYVKPYDNIDFSPLILLIFLYFLQYCIRYYFWLP